ncbi:Flagellar secretion chaperone FliS [bioreactor metagenome]|uniref:Flagellar secretion chaperone FliS n=1 Tax=bioreactor metagenome TaxID=1076179 RepID=A0A645AZM1_9ZZZZ
MTSSASQCQKYREQSVNAMTPGEQIILLFKQATVNISKAIKCINEKDICGAHNSIVNAQDIYAYLSDILNMSFEVSKSLYALYDFIDDRLLQANLNKDVAILDQVLSMTRELCATWEKAESESRNAAALKEKSQK